MKHAGLISFVLTVLLFVLACGTVPATEAPAAANFDPVTIKGTYELHSDLKGGEAFTFVANKVDLTVTFTATSQADNSMKGTAQVTYVRAHEFKYDEEGYEPCHQLWSLEPINWTTELNGTIQHNPDGSLTVALISNPKNGPSFTQDFDCDGPETETPQFPSITGLLVDGKFNRSVAYEPGPMQSGRSEERITMEVVE